MSASTLDRQAPLLADVVTALRATAMAAATASMLANPKANVLAKRKASLMAKTPATQAATTVARARAGAGAVGVALAMLATPRPSAVTAKRGQAWRAPSSHALWPVGARQGVGGGQLGSMDAGIVSAAVLRSGHRRCAGTSDRLVHPSPAGRAACGRDALGPGRRLARHRRGHPPTARPVTPHDSARSDAVRCPPPGSGTSAATTGRPSLANPEGRLANWEPTRWPATRRGRDRTGRPRWPPTQRPPRPPSWPPASAVANRVATVPTGQRTEHPVGHRPGHRGGTSTRTPGRTSGPPWRSVVVDEAWSLMREGGPPSWPGWPSRPASAGRGWRW